MSSHAHLQRYIAALAVASAVLSASCGTDVTDPGTGEVRNPGTGEGAPRDAVPVAARTVFERQTGWSGFDTPTRTLITDPAAWAAAWAKLYANVSPVPQIPQIDFSASVIVLAAMGTRPTGGYSVTIQEVRSQNGTLYVSVLERSPGPSCGTFQALTAPVHIVEVPRQGVNAHFTVAQETYSC